VLNVLLHNGQLFKAIKQLWKLEKTLQNIAISDNDDKKLNANIVLINSDTNLSENDIICECTYPCWNTKFAFLGAKQMSNYECLHQLCCQI
jgi:hypothetical protein